MGKQKNFKERGITLVALIITIILLLILAGIAISSLTGSGLFEKVQQAKQEQENAQIKEDAILADYENKINQYVNGTREQVTVDKEQYEQLLEDVKELKQSVATIEQGVKTEVLWTGSQSSGTLTLSDSIYNYKFLVFEFIYDGASAIITVDKDGMNNMKGGCSAGFSESEGVGYLGFYISSISEDGKTLNLVRSGLGNANSNWSSAINIMKITGIK